GIGKRLDKWILGGLALCLEAREQGRLFHLDAHVQRDQEQDERNQKRHAPTPSREVFFAEKRTATSDHQHADEEARGSRRLNEARVIAASVVRNVLGDVSCRTAIFPAQRQTLEQTQYHQQGRREQSHGFIRRQNADQRGAETHSGHRDQKRILATNQVTQVPEYDGAQRAYAEAST